MNTLQFAQLTEAALDAIGKLVNVDGNKAAAALVAIKAIVKTLREGTSGKLSPQAALTQIESLHASLASNEAEAVAALRERFEE